MQRPGSPSAGVRAITAYKAVKAGAQLAAALLLAVLLPLGLPGWVHDLAGVLRHHFTHAWATHAALLLERGSSHRGITLGILALGFDGTLTAIEAWALHTGRWWGPWLVVVATSALLPFEVYAWVRAPHASRTLLFAINLGIVIYLARQAWHEHRQTRQPSE